MALAESGSLKSPGRQCARSPACVRLHCSYPDRGDPDVGLCHAAGLISTWNPRLRMRLASLAAARLGFAAGEMIGAEVLVAGAVGQHVVGGRQDRSRHGDSSFLWTTACF
jgi:hypothetical protein